MNDFVSHQEAGLRKLLESYSPQLSFSHEQADDFLCSYFREHPSALNDSAYPQEEDFQELPENYKSQISFSCEQTDDFLCSYFKEFPLALFMIDSPTKPVIEKDDPEDVRNYFYTALEDDTLKEFIVTVAKACHQDKEHFEPVYKKIKSYCHRLAEEYEDFIQLPEPHQLSFNAMLKLRNCFKDYMIPAIDMLTAYTLEGIQPVLCRKSVKMLNRYLHEALGAVTYTQLHTGQNITDEQKNHYFYVNEIYIQNPKQDGSVKLITRLPYVIQYPNSHIQKLCIMRGKAMVLKV